MSGARAWPPVLALLVLAPVSAEMSWGGIPYTEVLVVVAFLAPLYGGAAVLIREAARRTGRGWPTILLLAAAFGILMAGVIDQSAFNPDYGGEDFQGPVHIDGIDIGLVSVIGFVGGHIVASIGVPIALVEACTRRQYAEPWLRLRGLVITAVVFVAAAVFFHVAIKDEDGNGFQARPGQTAVAVALVGLLIVIAFWLRPLSARKEPGWSGAVPRPWLLGVGAFAGYVLYLPSEDLAGVLAALVIVPVIVGLLVRWSRSDAWTHDHTLGVGVGAALTGTFIPFVAAPYDEEIAAGEELFNDSVAAVVCLAVVGLCLWRHRRVAHAQEAP